MVGGGLGSSREVVAVRVDSLAISVEQDRDPVVIARNHPDEHHLEPTLKRLLLEQLDAVDLAEMAAHADAMNRGHGAGYSSGAL